jgi:hypothetical protein
MRSTSARTIGRFTPRPVRNPVRQQRAQLREELAGRPHSFAPPTLGQEELGEVGVERDVDRRAVLPRRPPIELVDGEPHVVDSQIELAVRNDRSTIAQHSSNPVNIPQLTDRRPRPIHAPPVRSGRQPHGERFGEVLVGMFLCVPTFDVAHVFPAERHGPVVIAIHAVKRSEQMSPRRGAVQPIRVVDRVTGFVTHVHHDRAVALEIVDRLLELRETRIGEIERDADHRLAVGTAPLVGEVADGMELPEPLALELAVELLDEPLDPASPRS